MASTMPQTEPWEWKCESPINCLYVCTHGKGMKRWPTERDDPQGKESKRNERNPTWMYCTYRRSIDGHAHATPPSLIFATSYSCDGRLSRNPTPHLRTHSLTHSRIFPTSYERRQRSPHHLCVCEFMTIPPFGTLLLHVCTLLFRLTEPMCKPACMSPDASTRQ
jgi:hypothetical protein